MWGLLYDNENEIASHSHPDALYSCSYYVNAPKGSAPLIFTTSNHKIKAENGKLIVFDGRLDHHVPRSKINNDDKLSQVNLPRISILGRPNVGKSSFTNAILGEERNIVTEISGTTRDSIDTEYNMFNKNFIITDTAGIRKKSKVKENIEFYSVMRSIQALENSDVAIIMIDAKQGFEGQDMNILSLAVKYKKAVSYTHLRAHET